MIATSGTRQRQGSWQYNAILPQYQLEVYDRNTGTRTRMTNQFGSAFRPALSRDGKWLAFGARQDADTGLRLRELATGEEHWLAYPIQRDDQESIANMDVLPGYCLHAGLQGDRDFLWRRDLARAGRRYCGRPRFR